VPSCGTIPELPHVAKVFWPSQRETLIQNRARIGNIDSRARAPRFDCFKFQFHSICSVTFATVSANRRRRAPHHPVVAIIQREFALRRASPPGPNTMISWRGVSSAVASTTVIPGPIAPICDPALTPTKCSAFISLDQAIVLYVRYPHLIQAGSRLVRELPIKRRRTEVFV